MLEECSLPATHGAAAPTGPDSSEEMVPRQSFQALWKRGMGSLLCVVWEGSCFF